VQRSQFGRSVVVAVRITDVQEVPQFGRSVVVAVRITDVQEVSKKEHCKVQARGRKPRAGSDFGRIQKPALCQAGDNKNNGVCVQTAIPAVLLL